MCKIIPPALQTIYLILFVFYFPIVFPWAVVWVAEAVWAAAVPGLAWADTGRSRRNRRRGHHRGRSHRDSLRHGDVRSCHRIRCRSHR